MRRIAITVTLAVTLLLAAACSKDPVALDSVSEVRALVTADLTPSIAETRLGKPDAVEGSGLLIYRYNLKEGAILRLSFPGYQTIISATITYRNGTQETLRLN